MSKITWYTSSWNHWLTGALNTEFAMNVGNGPIGLSQLPHTLEMLRPFPDSSLFPRSTLMLTTPCFCTSWVPLFRSSVLYFAMSPRLAWALKPPVRLVFFVMTQIGFHFSIFSFLWLSRQAVSILRTRTLLGRTHGGLTPMHYWF